GTDRDVLGTLQNHVKDGHPFRGETVLYRRDGTPYVSQWSVAPVRDASGTITHWVAVQRDVTEQRDAEAALQERGDRIEALYTALDSLLEATTIRQVATEATTLVTDTLGLSGAIVWEAGPDELSSLATRGDVPAADPVDLDGAHPAVQAVHSGSVVGDDARLHVPLGTHGVLSIEDGRASETLPIRPLEVLAAHVTRMIDRIARAAAQRQAHERSEALRAASTALLEAASEPAGTEAAFEALAPLLPDTVRLRLFSFGPDDETARVRAANDRPLADLERGTAWPIDAGLQRFRDGALHVGDDLDGHAASVLEERLLRAGCRSYVAAPLSANGTVRGILLLAAEAPGAFTTAHRTLAEETADLLASALSRLAPEAPPEPSTDHTEPSPLKSAFLANVHHELRTPLTSIIGFAEVLGGDEVEASEQFADLIARSGRRLKETFDALLTLSRLEAGTMTLDPSPLSVATEVRTAVEAVEEQARAANLSLEWDGPEASLSAVVDHDGLHDIVHHLLNNAIKFTEDGDTVTVRLRETDDWIVLTVADTGIGMDPARVPELLKPFRQASTGLDRSHEGCGVGLAIVQRWADAMGGTVDVETARGEGTTVTVGLPKTPTAPVDA
ncbi:MAG TPA: ATP-binding protein, partial [Salinibacter sp.]|nr:ATP-binding protein [Salinibacter sp.]